MEVGDVRSARTLATLAAVGLCVGAAYYAGTVVGLALRLPHATPSVMWPPNAILTSALLLTRRSWWPVVLLSALPAHVALESGVGWPTPLVLTLFATNCSEALMAAGGLRWLSDAPTRFDSLRRVGVFVAVAVIAAPLISSFLDAAAVAAIAGEPFWPVWRSRLCSNALTALTVVPAVVTVGTSAVGWLRTATRAQRTEAALLALSMVALGTFVLQPAGSPDSGMAGLAEATAVSWFLPLLVWAALRFGPGGTSIALLATALFLIGAAVRTHGPFRGLSPIDSTRALQLFLTPMAVSLLVTAALVEERRKSADALRASEAMKADILASLMKAVVVLDRQGHVIAANESWRRMAGEDAHATAEIGGDYLDYYRAASRAGECWAADAAAGIEAIVRGTSREFWIDHTRHGPDGDRTVLIRAVALNRPEGGAVITHTDISDQKRAGLELQQARAELAHIARVSTVGALTASIAHQLNQPLTGILINARAAARFLQDDSPDLNEVRASLHDIVEDDRRASDVIVRMRELLQRDDGSLVEVDMNALVGDVARLLNSDAIMRNVALVLQIDPAAAIVRGDRVQLQQVVLNLIVNALEAVADRPVADRRVVVHSRCDASFVEVSVEDKGVGFDGAGDHVFDAFYTTKRGGMGLGLFIAKSIVRAHAGMIEAGNHGEGGARVVFRLPLAPGGDA